MHSLAPWDPQQAQRLVRQELARARAFLGDDGPDATALLPILHALQRAFGFLSSDAIALAAHELNLSKAEVKGVVSFYKDFRTSPPGKHVVALCRAEACQARGSEALAEHLARAHGLTPGATKDGITLETTYCLGNCTLGPTALVDETTLLGQLDAPAADRLVAGLKEKAP